MFVCKCLNDSPNRLSTLLRMTFRLQYKCPRLISRVWLCETDYCCFPDCFIHVVAGLFLEEQRRRDSNIVRVDFIEAQRV